MGKPPTYAERLAALRERHRDEERELLRAVLLEYAWCLLPAARALGVQISTLQSFLARHPELAEERQRRRAPGRADLALARAERDALPSDERHTVTSQRNAVTRNRRRRGTDG